MMLDQQTFNICMDEPVDYGELAAYLQRTRGIEAIPVRTAMHSNWLDNRKARLLLGWRPEFDMQMMADAAFDYQRAATDPRKVWYPGQVEPAADVRTLVGSISSRCP